MLRALIGRMGIKNQIRQYYRTYWVLIIVAGYRDWDFRCKMVTIIAIERPTSAIQRA